MAHSTGEHDLSEADRQILSNIAEYGWHVVKVAAEGGAPSWAFTVGLTESYGHDEIAVFGLPGNNAHLVLNDLGARVKGGETIAPGHVNPDVLRDLECHFRSVHPKWHGPFFGTALWYYGSQPFGVIQAFWPDRANRPPWQEGFEDEFAGVQPFLSEEALPPSRFDDWLSEIRE